MTPCACNKYLSPLNTFEEVGERCAVSDEILPSLEELVADWKKWMVVYRCKVCGTLWTKEYPFGERHGGGPPCLYVIEADDPEEWLNKANDLTFNIRRNGEDEKFYQSLGSEIGPEICSHEGCERKRISLSVMCSSHHFEMVRRKPCPFS